MCVYGPSLTEAALTHTNMSTVTSSDRVVTFVVKYLHLPAVSIGTNVFTSVSVVLGSTWNTSIWNTYLYFVFYIWNTFSKCVFYLYFKYILNVFVFYFVSKNTKCFSALSRNDVLHQWESTSSAVTLELTFACIQILKTSRLSVCTPMNDINNNVWTLDFEILFAFVFCI